MKRRASQAASKRIASVDVGNRTLVLYIGISLLLHIVLMAIFVIMPALTPSRRYIPSAVNVSLVSLPALGNGAAKAPAPEKPVVESSVPEKPAVKKEPVVKPVPVKPPPPPPKPEAEVSTAPTPKPKTKKKESLKHKTFKPSKVIKDAVSKMEKKVEETRPSKLEEAMNRLKQQVEKEDRSRKTDTGAGSGQAGTVIGSPRGSGLSSGQFRSRVQVYQAEIAYQVQKNWVFSELMSGGRTDLEAVLGFKIRPNGDISDIWFDQRSGNTYLDESAYRAIVKSNPLPPLPAGLFAGDYTVGIRFGPKGIK
ncbi:MAG: energy transducer TonB [Desulfobacterales bacterium]|jgi:colicin import membrane protein